MVVVHALQQLLQSGGDSANAASTASGVVAMDVAVTLTKVALPTAAASVKYLLLVVKFLEVRQRTQGNGERGPRA